MRVSSSSQSDAGVGGIEDGVETLTTYTKRSMLLKRRNGLEIDDVQECKSVDKVQALTAGVSGVTDDKVNRTRQPAYLRVKCSWPHLGVWRQLESFL